MHATNIPPTHPKRAALIDSISSLSDPLSSMSSMFSLVYLLTLAYQVRTPLPSNQERLLTLMHTMTMSPPASKRHEQQPVPSNSHADRTYARGEILNSFIHFLSPVLNGMAGMLELLQAVDAFSKPEDFREFWSLEGSNLIREFIESGGPLRRCMEGYDVPFLDAFVQDPTCRIALGKNKGLLLVPGDAKVGDSVWWDEEDECFTVSRQGEDAMNTGEARLEDGSWRAALEVQSAT
ncbi:hypothetical protein B0T10DRAFT_468821 [Thelonectria olida]|uniref:Uncharacterized protein n=1 Tax=Thelonectria olida TaxID=1576542 RepID=A0A9P8WHW8_9HYPO|nr:hypothetical protein B0T10DRAFT_468821 [Thelonectria olida]